MKIYLAPMEGITGEVYRRAYHTFFGPMDKYFTPFLNPNSKGKFSRQEWNEILPENNEGMYTVPQILTNRAEDFIRLARQLKEFGNACVEMFAEKALLIASAILAVAFVMMFVDGEKEQCK